MAGRRLEPVKVCTPCIQLSRHWNAAVIRVMTFLLFQPEISKITAKHYRKQPVSYYSDAVIGTGKQEGISYQPNQSNGKAVETQSVKA